MGFKNPVWSPFAADKQLHYFEKPATQFDYDISFVGSWNGERENVMAAICEKFPQLRIAIFGPGWNRARNKRVTQKAKNKPLRGKEYATVFNRTFININVVGEIAYPSVNMRFFEIPVAYGLQLVNYSPEQAGIFHDKQHLLYFDSTRELLDKITYYLHHPDEAMQIRKAGHELVCAEHTYGHRINKLLQHLQTID
jgi:spore maturation protein CgeB